MFHIYHVTFTASEKITTFQVFRMQYTQPPAQHINILSCEMSHTHTDPEKKKRLGGGGGVQQNMLTKLRCETVKSKSGGGGGGGEVIAKVSSVSCMLPCPESIVCSHGKVPGHHFLWTNLRNVRRAFVFVFKCTYRVWWY